MGSSRHNIFRGAFFICLESVEDESEEGYIITSSSEELIILYAFYVCDWSEALVRSRCCSCIRDVFSVHGQDIKEVLLGGLFKMGIF